MSLSPARPRYYLICRKENTRVTPRPEDPENKKNKGLGSLRLERSGRESPKLEGKKEELESPAPRIPAVFDAGTDSISRRRRQPRFTLREIDNPQNSYPQRLGC